MWFSFGELLLYDLFCCLKSVSLHQHRLKMKQWMWQTTAFRDAAFKKLFGAFSALFPDIQWDKIHAWIAKIQA